MSDWIKERELPPVARSRKPRRTEADTIMEDAVREGAPRSNLFPDRRAAILAARRLRHAAAKLPDVTLEIRYTTTESGAVKVWFQATRPAPVVRKNTRRKGTK